MKTALALLIAIAAVTPALAQSTTAVQSGSPEMIMDRAASDIFPESWLTAKISAKAEPLDKEEQPRGREIVERALAKYPAAVLGANLKKIHVVGRLEYSGVPTGGTNSRNAVYVVSQAKYSSVQIEKNFHAEFSSILLRNFPKHLDEAAWRKINPADFSYRGSGVQAIRSKQASLNPSDALHEEGFVNEYAKASLEEDFNSQAGRLFVGDAGLWSAIAKYPRVRAKADLVIAFYGKLDVSFTKEFFLSLRQPETK